MQPTDIVAIAEWESYRRLWHRHLWHASFDIAAFDIAAFDIATFDIVADRVCDSFDICFAQQISKNVAGWIMNEVRLLKKFRISN